MWPIDKMMMINPDKPFLPIDMHTVVGYMSAHLTDRLNKKSVDAGRSRYDLTYDVNVLGDNFALDSDSFVFVIEVKRMRSFISKFAGDDLFHFTIKSSKPRIFYRTCEDVVAEIFDRTQDLFEKVLLAEELCDSFKIRTTRELEGAEIETRKNKDGQTEYFIKLGDLHEYYSRITTKLGEIPPQVEMVKFFANNWMTLEEIKTTGSLLDNEQ